MPIFRTPYFSPLNIPDCSLWLDGADPAGNGVVPPAGNLATWVDKSTLANNAIAGTTVYPQYNTAFLNNLGVVGLTDGADYFTVVNNLNSESLTYILLVKPTTANTGDKCGILSTDTPGLFGRSIALNNMVFEIEIYNDFTFTSITTNSSTWYIVSVVFNGTSSITFSYNGIISTYAGSGTGTNSSGLTIGSYNNESSYTAFNANFYLAEAIVYSSALSQTHFQQVEGYLAQKWGLTASLPAEHPGLGRTLSKIIKVSRLPYYRFFNPQTISSLALWLDAADSSTVTGTSPITAWTDKSSAGRTVTITSGPTYGTTTRNGLKTMYFNNNVISSSIASAVGTGDFTLIAVWYQSFAGTNTVLSLGSVASSSQSLGYSGDKYNFYQFGSLESAYTTGPGWVVQVGTRISSIKRVYITGTIGSVPASDSFNVTDTTVTIGKGDNFPITGEIAEIMVYTGTMSDTDRQLLEGYLSQKWGLTGSLVAGHPALTLPVGAPATGVGKQTISYLPRTPSFSPLSITGLQVWLDANDSGTITQDATSNISQWSDKSSNGLNAVSNSFVGWGVPTYVSTGATKYVSLEPGQALYIPNFPYTTSWSVFSCMCNVSLGGRWYISPYSDLEIVLMGMGHGGNKIFPNRLGGGNDVEGGHIEYTSAENTDGTGAYTYYRDGSLIDSNNATSTSTGAPSATVRMGIGANGASGFDIDGTYYPFEILMYNQYLDNTDRQKIEGYLAWKWGLQASLPSDHPYKSGAP